MGSVSISPPPVATATEDVNEAAVKDRQGERQCIKTYLWHLLHQPPQPSQLQPLLDIHMSDKVL